MVQLWCLIIVETAWGISMVSMCNERDSTVAIVYAIIHTCVYLAGHYVPAFSRAILESNSIYAKNFKGMG